MLTRGELSSVVYHRRQTQIAVADLAKTSKRHTLLSRWRLKRFRAMLDTMEGNDQVEGNGETMCETIVKWPQANC